MQKYIKECQAFIITAGAGMGVDSGLPDFRGNKGFWTVYRPFENKFGFTDCANPSFMDYNPNLFWGFYGHRLHMYRNAVPHDGFQILKKIFQNRDYFVITSNVDGQFQKAGFDSNHIYEMHGSIHKFQCTPCDKLYDAHQFKDLSIDLEKFSAADPLPKCECKRLLRPNILMFGDWDWISSIYDQQEKRFFDFVEKNKTNKVCVIEIGAGTAIPSIRNLGDRILDNMKQSIMIRINPTEADVPKGDDRYFSIKKGGLEGIKELEV
ncbi:unnamed protein product (macronuclear) [Paramecium tetraurelia]|uniref:Deacetylase sirtuin-type domain-containing protein n=1 Tax=Paramecium tetraurelia TaxID=5888 RepID=A0D0F1_PARTE|nr:uncharacterized protein GSPATT00012070001 [Paramecium tetraurelia]CAK76518.1 unnamed protein product [Paramecium tetraurelia]|eukprot:XP_001443915.1 hypothetical protein (macronuclear) [Paramecium tetraurelia strain d4-2]